MSEQNSDFNMFKMTLSAAVPLWVVKMKDWTWQERAGACGGLADTIAYNSDVLFRGSSVHGEVARVFNSIAQGLAVLSYCPGGVTFDTLHWDAYDLLTRQFKLSFTAFVHGNASEDVLRVHAAFMQCHASFIKHRGTS